MNVLQAIVISIGVIGLLYSSYYLGRLHQQKFDSERHRLRAYIDGLPGWQPQFVLMHVEDQYNYLEIAAKLEMPAQFVLNELASAYATLRMRDLESAPTKYRWWERVRAGILYRLLSR